jgi:GMP synthase (glutamine-hydrolysing)
VKPFLLLQSRPEDEAAENEYEGFLRAAGLEPAHLDRIRMEAAPIPPFDLDVYSGVIIGGSPFNSGDPWESKSPVQRRVEAELRPVLDEIVERDFPFLGACYGIGTLGVHQGGLIDRTYGEPVGAVPVTVTDDGARDPLLAGLPATFDAFVGHKEACTVLPRSATLLATTPGCPVQMFRVKTNLYATQFHPELDHDGIITRIRVYQHAGYFPPEEIDDLISRVVLADVTESTKVLRNFVARYAR